MNKYEFIDYQKLNTNLPEVLAALDKVIGQCNLPREQHLIFHAALVQVQEMLALPDEKLKKA